MRRFVIASIVTLLAWPVFADEPVAEPSQRLAAYAAEVQANCSELVPYLQNSGPGEICENIAFLRMPWQPLDLRRIQIREAYAESDYGRDLEGGQGRGKDDPTSNSDGGGYGTHNQNQGCGSVCTEADVDWFPGEGYSHQEPRGEQGASYGYGKNGGLWSWNDSVVSNRAFS